MKKLFLALFLMAFVSVSFSAPAFKPVEKQEKKEFVKSSEVSTATVVVLDKDFSVENHVDFVFADIFRTKQSIYISHFPEKKALKVESIYHGFSRNRFILKHNYNKEKPDISG